MGSDGLALRWSGKSGQDAKLPATFGSGHEDYKVLSD